MNFIFSIAFFVSKADESFFFFWKFTESMFFSFWNLVKTTKRYTSVQHAKLEIE